MKEYFDTLKERNKEIVEQGFKLNSIIKIRNLINLLKE